MYNKAEQEQKIINMADNLASAAVGFVTNQGYDNFIQTRENFKKELSDILGNEEEKDDKKNNII